jgi:hypothetical protein
MRERTTSLSGAPQSSIVDRQSPSRHLFVHSRQSPKRVLYFRNVWRGGRAVDGGCLENSRAKAPGVRIPPSPSGQCMGRCQRGRMGPPAKRLRGLKSPSRVRIPPFPPRGGGGGGGGGGAGGGVSLRRARRIRLPPGHRTIARTQQTGLNSPRFPARGCGHAALSWQRLRMRIPSLPPKKRIGGLRYRGCSCS